eukprot:1161631-Pelagomonas_calceolata.AAC.5
MPPFDSLAAVWPGRARGEMPYDHSDCVHVDSYFMRVAVGALHLHAAPECLPANAALLHGLRAAEVLER